MRRLFPRSAALVIAATLAPSVSNRAHAQTEPSCETVTTVRCTGSAAPLALPGAQPPAPAPELTPPPAAPAPAPVPAPAPSALPPDFPAWPSPPARPAALPCCGDGAPPLAPTYTLATPQKIPGGWNLVRDEDGRLQLERKRRTGIAAVWAPGLALWLTSYIGSNISGFAYDHPYAAIPFFGALAAGGIDAVDGNVGSALGWTMGGLMQISGFIMFVAGASSGSKIERLPLQVAPLAFRDGSGVSLRARF